MLQYSKKKLIIILIYASFFITIPIIKNESRLIEKKIQDHKNSIFSLKKIFLEASLEFQYLTSPAVLSSKIANNSDQTYNSLDLSQIYLSIEEHKLEQKKQLEF
jgi:hypothetical protein|tara:strand:- start:61 stop:372 length:312 start_codon:yes stop_codon:yes gene_type:complete